jgi:hypothetical protein
MTTDKPNLSTSDFLIEVNDIAGFFADFHTAKNEALKSVRNKITKRELHLNSKISFGIRNPNKDDTPKSMSLETYHATNVQQWINRLESNKSIDLAAKSVIIFIFEIWEHKYRGNIIVNNIEKSTSHILGDIRLLRNSILHNKGIANQDIAKTKIFKKFKPGDAISLSANDIKDIIQHIHEDFAMQYFFDNYPPHPDKLNDSTAPKPSPAA